MAVKLFALTLSLTRFVAHCGALQVTPGSPCISQCLNPSDGNGSDPSISKTTNGDIVCQDEDYNKTTVGEKFAACVTCLQTSHASESGENDQAWYIYNLLYSLNTCLFEPTNKSDIVNTTCSSEESCGHLQQALQVNLGGSENVNAYAYCSEDNNAFLGRYLSKCVGCLRDSETEVYLANFLLALQAGCIQRPQPGLLIGIQGSIFSKTPIEIKYPGYSSSSSPTEKPESQKGLGRDTIVGISVGVGFVVLTAVAFGFLCWRRRSAKFQTNSPPSPVYERFAADTLTSPTDSTYGNSYTSSPYTMNQKIEPSTLSDKELAVLGLPRNTAVQLDTRSKDERTTERAWITPRSDSESSRSSPRTAIPIHNIHGPNPYSPASPATTIATAGSVDTVVTPPIRPSPRTMVSSKPNSPNSQTSHTQRVEDVSPRTHIPRTLSKHHPYGQLHSAQALHQTRQQQHPDAVSPSRVSTVTERLKRSLGHFGTSSTDAENVKTMQISAPIIQHSPRFESVGSGRRGVSQSPEGVVSNERRFGNHRRNERNRDSLEEEEQWPGAY